MNSKVNILSPEFINDPYPFFEDLRRDAPVSKVEPMGIWAVTRYEDVMQVLRTPEVFSSTAFQTVFRMLSPSITESDLSVMNSMIARDPPDHTRLRRLVNRAFTPKTIAALGPRIRQLSCEFLDLIADKPDFDLVHDFSMPLPVTVIAEMLGVDPSRREDFKRWSDDTISLSSTPGAQHAEEVERLQGSRREFHRFFRDMIEYRRTNPGDDMISALIKAEEKDDALSSEEIFSMTVLLLIAGNETTTNLLANGVRQLLRHPDIEQKIRANPERIPDFIEEVLRFDSPVLGLFRSVTMDTTLGGEALPAGAFVLPFFASANRDDRRFPNAGEFDIDRDARGHIAFGYGIHFCLGAPLARLEATIAIEELLKRLPSLKGDPDEVEWVNSFILRAPKRLRLINTALAQA